MHGHGYGCGCGHGDGCRCGRGHSDWGSGPGYRRWAGGQERIGSLEAYQRELEERAADVADEIKRLKERA